MEGIYRFLCDKHERFKEQKQYDAARELVFSGALVLLKEKRYNEALEIALQFFDCLQLSHAKPEKENLGKNTSFN